MLNIYINMKEVKSDKEFVENVMEEAEEMLSRATELRDKIFKDSIQLINS